MKNVLILRILIVLVLLLSITNCSRINLKNMPTISSLSRLEILSDTLFLDFKLDIPNKTLRKKLMYEFIPILILNETDTIDLKTKSIFGEKIEDKPTVIYKYGGEFIHSDTVIYRQKIESIQIVHESVVTVYDKQISIELPDNLIFECKLNDDKK